MLWRWAGDWWPQLVMGWVKNGIDWRRLSGVELTWLLYEMYVPNVPQSQLRRFYRSVNDVDGERRLADSLRDGSVD